MPNVRCRYYEDDGTPLNGGCPGQGYNCGFVHPSEPAWRNAPPPRSRYRSDGQYREKAGDWGGGWGRDGERGRGRGRGRGSGRGRGRDSYGDRGDGHGYGHGDYGNGGGDFGGPPAGSSDARTPTWGNGSAATFGDPPAWGVGGGGDWGAPVPPNNKGKEKAKDVDDTWGGWNVPTDATASTGAPPGPAPAPAPPVDASGWGIPSAEESGGGTESVWDTGGGEVEWGGGGWGDAAGSGGGWGEAAGSGDNSSGAVAGGGETGWGNTDEGPVRGNASEETVWATGPSAGEPAGAAMDVDEPLPQPHQLGGSAPQSSGRIAADPLSSVRQEFSKVLGEERKGDGEDDGVERDSDTDDDDDMGEPNDPESLLGKRQASRRYLKIVQRAIAAQLKLSDARLARAQWSKARHSVIYEHPGHAARIILDATTSKYENEVNRRQEQLDKALSDLRDLSTTMYDYVKDFKPEQKQKQAEQYLEEVKGWVKSLRPLVEVAEQREKEAQARRNAHIFDDPPMPDQLAPIYTRIKGLAEAMDDREAKHDYQAFMNLERDLISERIHARTRDIATPYARAQLAAEDEVMMGPLDEVVAKGVKVNSQLDDQASMIASLCKDQKVIVGRHEQVNKHFTTIEPRLVQLEKKSAEAQQTVNENEQQLEKLKAVFAAYQARLPQNPSTVSPDLILEQLTPHIEKQAEDNLRPTFDSLHTTLRDRLDDHQASLYNALHEQVLPLFDMMAPARMWMNEMIEAEARGAEGS